MDCIKLQVLRKISNGQPIRFNGGSWAWVGDRKVHIRKNTKLKIDGKSSTFGIAEGTLSEVDAGELWICASAVDYYLIPMIIIREMYPDAYPDHHNDGSHELTVDITSHQCHGRRAAVDFSHYFRATIDDMLPPLLDGIELHL